MAVEIIAGSMIAGSGQTVPLSRLVSVAGSPGNPAYLVLDGLDRNEYTAGESGATGYFAGSGSAEGFTALDSDARGNGIVFAYQSSTGRYYNTSYGYLDQLSYVASTSTGDVTDLSLFGTSSLRVATLYGANADAMMQANASGYLGTVTVATEPGFTGLVPSQATPDGIAAAADSFVGQAWNMDGCWVLASTIAAEAGASLPVQSTEVGLDGQANGEWFVAFDGPAGQTGNWESMVTTGDVIAFETGTGGGHITTCVAGSGSSALLVDNITYENAYGQVLNSAGDGSADDVTVEAPHAASEEWSGVPSDSVVIYELNTPVVTARSSQITVAAGSEATLSALFAASDPAGTAITAYQVYSTGGDGGLLVSGGATAAASAATAATVSTLSQVDLQAGAGSGSDAVEVRAFNGSYWGDWASLGVTVTAAASPGPSNGSSTGAVAFNWTDAATGNTGSSSGMQFLWSSGDAVAVAAQTGSVDIVGGTAGDALEASAGSNVLDGGLGSNFLIGANGEDGGTDQFFMDGRGGATFWDTLVNFHAGDTATLWGFASGVNGVTWVGSAGAPGYTGATLDFTAGGTMSAGSLTFAGVSLQQAQQFTVSLGSQGGVAFLQLRNAG